MDIRKARFINRQPLVKKAQRIQLDAAQRLADIESEFGVDSVQYVEANAALDKATDRYIETYNAFGGNLKRWPPHEEPSTDKLRKLNRDQWEHWSQASRGVFALSFELIGDTHIHEHSIEDVVQLALSAAKQLTDFAHSLNPDLDRQESAVELPYVERKHPDGTTEIVLTDRNPAPVSDLDAADALAEDLVAQLEAEVAADDVAEHEGDGKATFGLEDAKAWIKSQNITVEMTDMDVINLAWVKEKRAHVNLCLLRSFTPDFKKLERIMGFFLEYDLPRTGYRKDRIYASPFQVMGLWQEEGATLPNITHYFDTVDYAIVCYLHVCKWLDTCEVPQLVRWLKKKQGEDSYEYNNLTEILYRSEG